MFSFGDSRWPELGKHACMAQSFATSLCARFQLQWSLPHQSCSCPKLSAPSFLPQASQASTQDCSTVQLLSSYPSQYSNPKCLPTTLPPRALASPPLPTEAASRMRSISKCPLIPLPTRVLATTPLLAEAVLLTSSTSRCPPTTLPARARA
jgi:hypothetical protein